MSSPAHVQAALQSFLEEQFNSVSEEGTPSKLLVEHEEASGLSKDFFALKSGTAAWTNPADMAATILRVADRDAKGRPGQQQYHLRVFFGASNQWSRSQPFGLAGVTQFGPIPGGFSTEGANPTGQLQQTMRQAELILQGSFAQNRHTFDIMVALIRDLSALLKDREEALKVAQTELHDCWVAIKELTASFMEIATKVQVDVINAKRNAELLTDAAGLLPAAINGVTGKPIFPVAAADSELLRKLVKVMDGVPGETAAGLLTAGSALAQAGGADGQAVWTLLMGRLEEIRKDGVARTKRIEQMAGEAEGISLADALTDAAGKAVVSLRDAGKKSGGNGGGNGNGSHVIAPTPAPAAAPSQPTVEGEASSGFAEFGEGLLSALDEGTASMVVGMMRQKGRGDLADKAEKLRDVLRARAASASQEPAQPAQSAQAQAPQE